MTIENELKELIISRYGTIKAFAVEIGMPNSTLDSIFRRGIQNASITNVIKICHQLNISTDQLCNGRIVPSGDRPSAVCCNFQIILDDLMPPSDSELELLRKLRALSPVHRAAIETLVEQFYPVDSGEKRGDISGTA